MSSNAERFGPTHQHWRRRCSQCGHFARGPAGDTIVQCTNPEAPLYRASEYMDKATACRMFKERAP